MCGVTGFVATVGCIRKNKTQTRDYFTVRIKVACTCFKRVIVSNHKHIQRIRQQFTDFAFSKEPITLHGLGLSNDALFFNTYSEMVVAEEAMTFNYDEANATPLINISEPGIVASIVGKVRFTGEDKIQNYTRNDKVQTERLREGIISDCTACMPITVWGDLINDVKEDHLMQICQVVVKPYNDSLVLNTQYKTDLCCLIVDIEVKFDDASGITTDEMISKNASDTKEQPGRKICCHEIGSLKVFHKCKACKNKLETVSGTGFSRCKCGREYLKSRLKATPDCTQLVVLLDLEKGDSTESVSIFSDVLTAYFEVNVLTLYKDDLVQLKERLFKLSDVDFFVNVKNIVTVMKNHI